VSKKVLRCAVKRPKTRVSERGEAIHGDLPGKTPVLTKVGVAKDSYKVCSGMNTEEGSSGFFKSLVRDCCWGGEFSNPLIFSPKTPDQAAGGSPIRGRGRREAKKRKLFCLQKKTTAQTKEMVAGEAYEVEAGRKKLLGGSPLINEREGVPCFSSERGKKRSSRLKGGKRSVLAIFATE